MINVDFEINNRAKKTAFSFRKIGAGLVFIAIKTINMSTTDLSAQQAAQKLGVTLPTLYAYVSRGLIRSEPSGGRRQRRYKAEDIEALLQRKQEKGGTERALAGALSWGEPLCESSLTLIHQGRLYYRGHEVSRLAQNSSLENVIELLWGEYWPEPAALQEALTDSLRGIAPFDAFRLALPWLGRHDPRAFDLRPQGLRASGSRILGALVTLAGGRETSGCLAERLADAWAPGKRALLEAALILCADHELNVSAFTARCVASAGATPYEVVSAGMAALSGHRHGGHCAKVEALMAEAQISTPREALLRRMREGIEVPGFAHLLYPDGDPRGNCLLEMMGPLDPVTAGLIGEANDLLQVRPNIDFALVALCRSLALASGSALALFALGRTVGWVAHAIEQVATGQLIRPRARYIGAPPSTE
jgi:citrate synthase